MKISKLIKRKNIFIILKLVGVVFVVAYLFFAPFTVVSTLLRNQALVNDTLNMSYMGVLELWNIDTFEGGSVSRTAWLEKRAIRFEKEHTGTYIMVINMSLEQAKLNFDSGKTPNMISFGIGAGETVLSHLINYSGSIRVRDDLIKGGEVNKSIYAVPYILGGYIISSENDIEKNITNLGYGEKSNNNFSLALALNDYKATSIYEKNEELDSFDAYDKYLKKQFDFLCGTQRDAYRINNKINNGSLSNQNIEYLGGFSDLIQYIGICKGTNIENELCNEFIDFLTSYEIQKTLSNISMFSVLDISIYNDGYLKDMESILTNKLKTINVFLSDNKLDEIKEKAKEILLDCNKSNKELVSYLA